MESSINDAVKRIRQFRKEQGITKFRLSVLAGVPEGSLRKIDDKAWNPTLDTLKSLDKIVNKKKIKAEVGQSNASVNTV